MYVILEDNSVGPIRTSNIKVFRPICLLAKYLSKETGLYIEPAGSEKGSGKYHPADIETYEDHRIAMAFALTGLRIPGINILNPSCCRKTFEKYFEVLDSICK